MKYLYILSLVFVLGCNNSTTISKLWCKYNVQVWAADRLIGSYKAKSVSRTDYGWTIVTTEGKAVYITGTVVVEEL